MNFIGYVVKLGDDRYLGKNGYFHNYGQGTTFGTKVKLYFSEGAAKGVITSKRKAAQAKLDYVNKYPDRISADTIETLKNNLQKDIEDCNNAKIVKAFIE